MKRFSLILFFSLFLFILVFSSFCFAQRPLELEYPEIGGIKPETVKTAIPDYVKYIFNFTIWIAGLAAFGALIYGGFRYLTSAGSPAAIADAKDQIFAGILGLIILISSYLIFTTINPQLVIVQIGERKPQPPLEYFGVYLCESQEVCQDEEKCLEEGTCALYAGHATDLEDFHKKGNYSKISNPEDTTYFAIVHSEDGYRGDCQIIEKSGSLNFKPASIHVFQKSTDSSGETEGVTLYERKNYNKDCEETEGEECYLKCPPEQVCGRCECRGPYKTGEHNPNFKGNSIEVEGPWAAVAKGGGRCEVFSESDQDLAPNQIGVCDGMGCLYNIKVFQISE
jgi:hypothetical protein